MGQKETIFLESEDLQDFHRLAAKLFGRDPSKPGRPTKEEQEFRNFLGDFEKFRLLKSTGAFDKFFSELSQTDTRESSERPKRDRTGDGKSLFDGLLGGDLSLLKFFSEETLQETIKEGMIRYAPILGLVVMLWVAEDRIKVPTGRKIKVEKTFTVPIIENDIQVGTREEVREVEVNEMVPVPPILHTSFNVLVQLLRLVDLLGNLVSGGFGGLFDFIEDPIGSTIDTAQGTVAAIFGIDPDETTEERTERHKKSRDKLLEKLEKKRGRGF